MKDTGRQNSPCSVSMQCSRDCQQENFDEGASTSSLTCTAAQETGFSAGLHGGRVDEARGTTTIAISTSTAGICLYPAARFSTVSRSTSATRQAPFSACMWLAKGSTVKWRYSCLHYWMVEYCISDVDAHSKLSVPEELNSIASADGNSRCTLRCTNPVAAQCTICGGGHICTQ